MRTHAHAHTLVCVPGRESGAVRRIKRPPTMGSLSLFNISSLARSSATRECCLCTPGRVCAAARQSNTETEPRPGQYPRVTSQRAKRISGRIGVEHGPVGVLVLSIQPSFLHRGSLAGALALTRPEEALKVSISRRDK